MAAVKISFPSSRRLNYSVVIMTFDASKARTHSLGKLCPDIPAPMPMNQSPNTDSSHAGPQEEILPKRLQTPGTGRYGESVRSCRLLAFTLTILFIPKACVDRCLHIFSFLAVFDPVFENRLEVSTAHSKSFALRSCFEQANSSADKRCLARATERR